MRWFVMRNGETQGPVDEAQLAGWIRGGMRDASVRDESGGSWMPLAQSPFASLVTPDPAVAQKQLRSQLGALAFLALLGLGGWLLWTSVRDSWAESTKKSDAEFCAKNLDYYEKFCAVYPANCTEGARKLAKCDP